MLDSIETLTEKIVRIPSSFHYNDIKDWCVENKIDDVVFVGRHRDNDLWFIRNPNDRILFILRWK